MATYADIISRKLPGSQWTLLDVLDYATLSWVGPGGKPTKQALDGWNAEVDAAIAVDRLKQQQADKFAAIGPDQFFTGIEILTNAVVAIYGVLSAAQKSGIPAATVNAVASMQTVINQIRAG